MRLPKPIRISGSESASGDGYDVGLSLQGWILYFQSIQLHSSLTSSITFNTLTLNLRTRFSTTNSLRLPHNFKEDKSPINLGSVSYFTAWPHPRLPGYSPAFDPQHHSLHIRRDNVSVRYRLPEHTDKTTRDNS